MNQKKKRERSILSLIYDETEYADVVESELPDFKIRQHHSESCFGVEVTELHYSEANARMRYISGYLEDIFSHGKYRHKQDQKMLSVTEVTIRERDGAFKSKALANIQEVPSYHTYVSMIIRVLQAKRDKYENYDQKLSHVNLIIFDVEDRMFDATPDDCYFLLFRKELREALYKSPFREVFLITKLRDNRSVYLPLRLLLLLGDYYMITKAVLDHFPDVLSTYSNDTIGVFARYIRTYTEQVYIIENGAPEVVFGNGGLSRTDRHFGLVQYNDHPHSAHAVLVPEDNLTSFFRSEEFRNKEEVTFESFRFSTPLAYDTNRMDEWENERDRS